jgi:dipeptidase E
MKLFLASEAKHPESIKRLEEYVGGFTGKKIAFIPTAANGESSYGSWKTEARSWKIVNTLKAHVEPVVLEEYRNASVIKHLKGKDIVWVAGGMCGYLMYWMRRCEIDKHIKEILSKGTIYVGSSAGSMVCSPSLTVAETFPGDSELGASAIPGLDLIKFNILPHFEDGMMEKIRKFYKGARLYLLKNGEAITVIDGIIKVLGEKRTLV